jgi:hypothetical protein
MKSISYTGKKAEFTAWVCFNTTESTTNDILAASEPSKHVFPPSYLSLRGYPRSRAKRGQRSRIVPDHSGRPARLGNALCPHPSSSTTRDIVCDGRVPGRPSRTISGPPHAVPSSPIRQRFKCDRPVLHPRVPASRRRLRLSPISLLLGPTQLPM